MLKMLALKEKRGDGMRFSKKFSKFSYTLAILHGFLIGAVSIGLFAIMIQWQDLAVEAPAPTATDTETPEKMESVDAPANTATDNQFYAKQYGVFTGAEGASALLQSTPAMKTAALIMAEGQYYVWSEASVVESDVKIVGSTDSFSKPFKINASACKEQALQKLPIYLTHPDPSKFNFESTKNTGAIPKDWETNITAISTLSKDVNVIRVQLLSHYLSQNNCLKIEF
ncbi:hypothetical protein [Paenisporosarcina antarctica]|uniref:Uncharacterized protein n=1 Tax=Paenisporosarcina antarctica TaxID=417367 RepID=A0A4P6ZWL4_9BACL|nr:hypothetical protein [Paenisporosarcina antarctica]QBP40772.1 hypothetical protein E2636_06395 [Paenisporosarcina antarctica]